MKLSEVVSEVSQAAQACLEGGDGAARRLRREAHMALGVSSYIYPVMVSGNVCIPRLRDDGAGRYIAVPLYWVVERRAGAAVTPEQMSLLNEQADYYERLGRLVDELDDGVTGPEYGDDR